MMPDLDWQAQAAAWTFVWVAAGLAIREVLAGREERDEQTSGHNHRERTPERQR